MDGARKGGLGRRVGAGLLLIGLGLGFAVAAGELLLRLWPGLIGPEVLLEFDKRLRAEIAADLGLPVKQARRCIEPSERLDRGPELCLIAPDLVYHMAADAADLELGAVQELPHDRRGFCNPPAAAAPPTADVVFLGDSFTWCTLVEPEATFAAGLGDRLGVHAYNLGVPGVGPHEYVEVLQRFGLELRPRLVVLSLYEGNDLRDAARFAEHAAKASGPDATDGAGGGTRRWRDVVMTRSWFLNFATGAIEVLAKRWRLPPPDFGYEVMHQDRWRPMNLTNGDVDEPRTAARVARGEIGPELWGPPLRHLVKLGQGRGFVPLIAYLPAAYTAFAPAIRFNDSAIGAAVAEMSRRQRAYLRQLADRLEVPLVDCTEPMQAAAGGALAYFPANLHLTPAGHALVADCLEAAVRRALELAPGPAGDAATPIQARSGEAGP